MDVLEPTAYDLADAPTDAAKYVLLAMPVSMLNYLDDIFELARSYGLHGYSGVADEPF